MTERRSARVKNVNEWSKRLHKPTHTLVACVRASLHSISSASDLASLGTTDILREIMAHLDVQMKCQELMMICDVTQHILLSNLTEKRLINFIF